MTEAGAEVSEPPAAEQPHDPFEDRSKVWETMAALQYRADGVADGWDSDEPDRETPEQKYIKVGGSALQLQCITEDRFSTVNVRLFCVDTDTNTLFLRARVEGRFFSEGFVCENILDQRICTCQSHVSDRLVILIKPYIIFLLEVDDLVAWAGFADSSISWLAIIAHTEVCQPRCGLQAWKILTSETPVG